MQGAFFNINGRPGVLNPLLMRLPPAARFLVGVFAIPGIVVAIIGLATVLLGLTLMALLAGPVYLAMKSLFSPRVAAPSAGAPFDLTPPSGVRRVESTTLE
jgi:hypothetical protein